MAGAAGERVKWGRFVAARALGQAPAEAGVSAGLSRSSVFAFEAGLPCGGVTLWLNGDLLAAAGDWSPPRWPGGVPQAAAPSVPLVAEWDDRPDLDPVVAPTFVNTPEGPTGVPQGCDPEMLLDDFEKFRSEILGRVSLPWQIAAAEDIRTYVENQDSKDYLVINAPPGSGKSTLFTHDIPCWLIARNREIRIMIGSASGRLAANYGQRIRTTLERREPFRASSIDKERGTSVDGLWTMSQAFGQFKPEGRSMIWRSEEFTVLQAADGPSLDNKEPTVSTWGADTQFLGGRFDFVVWDDLMTRKFRKPEAMESLIETWDNEAETRVDPGGVFVLQGQRLRYNDLYHYCLSKETDTGTPMYEHIVYPAHDEATCDGDHGPDAKPQGEGGCLLDPHRLPWTELNRIRIQQPDKYATVYQQQDGSPGSTLVDEVWIAGGIDSEGVPCDGCRDMERSLLEVPPDVDLARAWSFVTVDPSPTQYWGVIWWLYDPSTNRRHIIGLHRAKMKSTGLLDYNMTTSMYGGLLEEWRIKAEQLRIPIESVVLEVNAAQRWLFQTPHAVQWGRVHGIRLLPHSTGTNKNDPNLGVDIVGPLFQQGLVRIPFASSDTRLKVADLTTELTHYPNVRTTDMVMTTWFHVLAIKNHYTPRKAGSLTFNRPGRMARARRALQTRTG